MNILDSLFQLHTLTAAMPLLFAGIRIGLAHAFVVIQGLNEDSVARNQESA